MTPDENKKTTADEETIHHVMALTEDAEIECPKGTYMVPPWITFEKSNGEKIPGALNLAIQGITDAANAETPEELYEVFHVRMYIM
jgi:hypothetical protein